MAGRRKILGQTRDQCLSSLKALVDTLETEDAAERRLTGATHESMYSSFPIPLEVFLRLKPLLECLLRCSG